MDGLHSIALEGEAIIDVHGVTVSLLNLSGPEPPDEEVWARLAKLSSWQIFINARHYEFWHEGSWLAALPDGVPKLLRAIIGRDLAGAIEDAVESEPVECLHGPMTDEELNVQASTQIEETAVDARKRLDEIDYQRRGVSRNDVRQVLAAMERGWAITEARYRYEQVRWKGLRTRPDGTRREVLAGSLAQLANELRHEEES